MGERERYVPSEEVERRHHMEQQEGERTAEGVRQGFVQNFEAQLEELEAVADKLLEPSRKTGRQLEQERDAALARREANERDVPKLLAELDALEEKADHVDFGPAFMKDHSEEHDAFIALSGAIMEYTREHPEIMEEWGALFGEIVDDELEAGRKDDVALEHQSVIRSNGKMRAFALAYLPQETLLELGILQRGELTERPHEDLDVLIERFQQLVATAHTLFGRLSKEAKKEFSNLVKRQLNPEYRHAKDHAAAEPWRLERFYQTAIERVDAFIQKYQSQT